jgi:hypothetical protein
MGHFMRAIIWGFGFSLGAALYKKVSDQLELERSPQPPPQPVRETPPPDGDGGQDAAAPAV